MVPNRRADGCVTWSASVELERALDAAGLPPASVGLPPASAGVPRGETPPPRGSTGRRALDWADSGLMWLTGRPGHPPAVPDAPVLERAQAAADLLLAVSTELGSPVVAEVAELLGGRAALLGLSRGGTVSANGSCRLLRAGDGWVAINLPRADDVDAVPALLGADPAEILATVSPSTPSTDATTTAWAALAAALPARSVDELVGQAWLLGLPLAALPTAHAAAGGTAGSQVAVAPIRVLVAGPRQVPAPGPAAPGTAAPGPATPGSAGAASVPPLVVDLSSLWAGPLAARLLGRMGLRVVKVESPHRLDGARLGDPDFYRWLHAGQEEARFDFTTPSGRAALRDLVEQADVVIEGSRPRALAQLGLDAERWVTARPGRIWLSITGYGRRTAASAAGAGPVAFGDDAAVAGGLVAWDRAAPAGPLPLFCGDAIADPLTGLYGALAVALCRAGGVGALLDAAMADVTAFVASSRTWSDPAESGLVGSGLDWSVTGSDQLGWTVHQAGYATPVRPPRRPHLPD